jgi:hypothetical protein
MADDRYTVASEDDAALLRKILSPAEAQSLVSPLTPRLTGSLTRPPAQAAEDATRRGLAGYFAAASAPIHGAADRSGDPNYVKVLSKGQVGYLPKTNLSAARQIDANLKVLDEG